MLSTLILFYEALVNRFPRINNNVHADMYICTNTCASGYISEDIYRTILSWGKKFTRFP